jgi:uncharacterized protein YceK
MKALLLLLALLLSGCKVVFEVTQDATIGGKPVICHRVEGAKQWRCDQP